jgi:hypothetical protein
MLPLHTAYGFLPRPCLVTSRQHGPYSSFVHPACRSVSLRGFALAQFYFIGPWAAKKIVSLPEEPHVLLIPGYTVRSISSIRLNSSTALAIKLCYRPDDQKSLSYCHLRTWLDDCRRLIRGAVKDQPTPGRGLGKSSIVNADD